MFFQHNNIKIEFQGEESDALAFNLEEHIRRWC